MNKTQLGYMNDLVKVLRDADAKYQEDSTRKFCMRYFQPFAAKKAEDLGIDCNTPGCALGHYVAAYPDRNEFMDIPDIDTTEPAYWGSGGAFEHAKLHFGLYEYEARLLFDTIGCGGAKTAGEAANYIQLFIDQKVAAGEIKEG